MARRRKASLMPELIRLAIIAFLLGSSSFFAFWNSIDPQTRTIIIVLLVAILITGSALIVLWIQYRKEQRKIAWDRAMSAWGRSIQQGTSVRNTAARHFRPYELEKFAAQLFRQMGYRASVTGQSGDHGVDVRLVNPLGEVELVQCKQWNKPVGEKEVRDLAGAMMHNNAVRGFIFAPGGFSQAAKQWARGKKIVLADEEEIGRLVESAYSEKGK